MMLIWTAISTAAALPVEAGHALKRGDCAAAIAAYPKPEEDIGKLAIGRCQLRVGNAEKALGLLLEIGEPYREHASLFAAEAELMLQNPGGAERLLDGIGEGYLEQRAKLLRAKALIQTDEHTKARDILRSLLTGKLAAQGYVPPDGGIDPGEVRWLLAEAARLRGAPEKGIPVWWRIWTDNPSSAWASEAVLRLIQNGERVPDSTSDAGRKHIERRAQTLAKLNMHKEALEMLDHLPADSSSKGRSKMAYACFRAKDYSRASAYFSKLPAMGAEDLFHYALGTSRDGDYSKAAELYASLYKKFPQHSRADQASYKVGYLSYDAGDLELSMELFNQHLARYPLSRHAAETRWFIGWSLVRLGRHAEARDSFGLLLKNHPRSSLAPGATYWKSRTLELDGDKEAAERGYAEVLRRWPVSGHAWHAARHLEKSFPLQPAAELGALPKMLDVPAFHRGGEMADAGFELWARDELRGLVKTVAGKKEPSLYLAHTLISAGDYTGAQRLAKPYCVSPWAGGDPLAQQACYPRPHGEALHAQMAESGLAANLPYAIMTAESALMPWVSSPAGARGLMQLMPEVAEPLHHLNYKGSLFDPDDLYQAGYNSRLGVAELIRLESIHADKPMDSSLPLVIASYNGGVEAVERWLALYGEPPSAERFSEDIGYTETRRYVRRVLGYLMVYNFVYGG
jgi:soluble lytic murein transglycosylase-like protein